MFKRRKFRVVPSLCGEGTYYSIQDSWNKEAYIINFLTIEEAEAFLKQLKALHKLSEKRWETRKQDNPEEEEIKWP